MRRLIPQHFRRDGKAKVSLTQSEAVKKANAEPAAWKAYLCTFCGNWHLARKK